MTPATPARLRALLRAALTAVLGAGLLALLPAPAAAQADRSTVVNIVQIAGAIEPAYADYIADEIRRSEREGHLAVLLRLDSAGSIKVDDAALITVVAESKVPVATWVGPDDAKVSGLAAALWYVGDIRLRGRDGEIGDVAPLQPGGRRELTSREAATVAAAVETAAGGAPPLTAATLREAVGKLDGQQVGDRKLVVDATQVTVRFATPGLLRRVRHTLVAPTLAYLLLLAGVMMLVFELFQPGFGPAGYAGVLTVALAVYGLVGLPLNPLFLVLLLASLLAMTFDVARNTLGPPTYGGLVAFAAASWFLFHSRGPALRLPWGVILFAVVASFVFFAVVMTVVLRALRGQSAEMGRALLGRIGEVRSTLNPQGHVLVEGALWRARAIEWDGPVGAGTKVEITGVDQEALILDVQPVTAERG
jgi:membrane-bound serine protease (ClpP class)